MFDAPMSTTRADAFPEANLENPLARRGLCVPDKAPGTYAERTPFLAR